MSNSFGVYFLADDGVYDWAITLLRSFQSHATGIPLYCIPFSNKLARLSRLTKEFRFEIVEDRSFSELDAIGREMLSFQPRSKSSSAGMFRKSFAFWGPLDRFLYTDADVVVLDGFTPFFHAEVNSDHPFQYAHASPDEVYQYGVLRDDMMRTYQTHSLNAGFWMSRRGVLGLATIRESAIAARSVASQFCNTIDQPFLNYCLDTNKVQIRRLVTPGMECAWAGDVRPLNVDSLGPAHYRAAWPDGTVVPAIHWAGYRLSQQMPYYEMHRQIRTVGMGLPDRFRLKTRELAHAARRSSLGKTVRAVMSNLY